MIKDIRQSPQKNKTYNQTFYIIYKHKTLLSH